MAEFITASQILELDREVMLREACTSAFDKYRDLEASDKGKDIFYKSLDKYISKLQVRLKGSGKVKFDDWGFEKKSPLFLQGYVAAFTCIRDRICISTNESVEEVPRRILYFI